MKSQSYTGYSSRKVPFRIAEVLTKFAKVLDEFGMAYRSGGDEGVDAAIERGAEMPFVYLPWNGFKGREGAHYIPVATKLLAARLHPSWSIVRSETRLTFERDIIKLLSPTMDKPVRFVICWEPEHDPKSSRNNTVVTNSELIVSHAIELGIPVFNMANAKDLAIINNVIESNLLSPLNLDAEALNA